MSNETALLKIEPGAPLAMIRPVINPVELIAYHDEVARFVATALKDGTDYMQIPGTGQNAKAALTKAGSERLVVGFGCIAEFEIMESEADHNYAAHYSLPKWIDLTDPGKAKKEELKAQFPGRFRSIKKGNDWKWQEAIVEEGEALGLYRYVVRCRLCRRDSGEVIGTGVGSCSTMESKYIRSPRESENTVLKMAKKRAQVDAVLGTFGLSDRFTQDVEDKPKQTGSGDDAMDADFHEEKTEVAETPEQIQQRLNQMVRECGFGKETLACFMAAVRAGDPEASAYELIVSAHVAGARSVQEVYEHADVPFAQVTTVVSESEDPVATGQAAGSTDQAAEPAATGGGNVAYGIVIKLNNNLEECTDQQVKKACVMMSERGVTDDQDMRLLLWGLLCYVEAADITAVQNGTIHGLTKGQISGLIDWLGKADASVCASALGDVKRVLAKHVGQGDLLGEGGK